MFADLRLALRDVRRHPGFAAAVALTLALGVGANTAIFGVVDALLLRALPYPDPGRLVVAYTATPADVRGATSLPDFLDWRAGFRRVGELAAYDEAPYTVGGSNGAPEHADGATVTANFLHVLGAAPALGRGFSADEERGSAPRVVMLGYDFWRRRYAGDPAVVGRTITLNTVVRTVVGVAPPELVLPAHHDVLVPLRIDVERPRRDASLAVVGRLAPGATLDGARRTLAGVAAELRAQYLATNGPGLSVDLVPMQDVVVGAARPALLVLMAAVGLVMLVACANVANLLLVRATTREREMALRAALGATRHRIARQLLVESVVLALAGGALGVGLAALAVRGAPLDDAPRLAAVALDGRVLAFALAVSVATGLLFGLAPALHLARVDLQGALRGGGRGVAGPGGAPQRLRVALITGEVALSVVLLVGTGLLLRSFAALQAVRPGFAAEGVLTAQLDLPGRRYPKLDEQPPAFWAALLAQLRATPGVRAAAVASNVPLTGGDRARVTVAGRATAPDAGETVRPLVVSEDYFRTLGIPLVRGRAFTAEDGPRAPRVVVVNAEAARRFWGGRDPLRAQVTLGDPADTASGLTNLTVVGVVGDVAQAGVAAPPEPQVYAPAAQHPARGLFVAVRTAGAPEALTGVVRRAVAALDPELPVFDVATMPARVAKDVARPRATAALVALFGAVALLLAAVGIYGVVAYAVAQRTRELGVRLALGARASDVVRLVVRQAMTPVAAGTGVGLVAAGVAARAIRGLLYGVGAADPVTFVAAPLFLTVIALLASWLPGQRAGRVPPATALRTE